MTGPSNTLVPPSQKVLGLGTPVVTGVLRLSRRDQAFEETMASEVLRKVGGPPRSGQCRWTGDGRPAIFSGNRDYYSDY